MNLHTYTYGRAYSRTNGRTHARTHAHNYTRSQLVGYCQRNETYIHHDYTPLTHLESSDCAESERKRKWERKKNTATAKCSVSIINSDGSKGISFVFKCFNLLFATFEVGTTFSYCELNFKITKVYNGNGFLSYYYYYFVFFLSLSLVFLSTKSPSEKLLQYLFVQGDLIYCTWWM